jgi:hypothetical protein
MVKNGGVLTPLIALIKKVRSRIINALVENDIYLHTLSVRGLGSSFIVRIIETK